MSANCARLLMLHSMKFTEMWIARHNCRLHGIVEDCGKAQRLELEVSQLQAQIQRACGG